MLQHISRWLIPLLLVSVPAAAASLRDPTKPPSGWQVSTVDVGNQSNALVLNSVISGPGGKHAVINNQVYRVGDSVNGVVIRAIHDNQVSLADGRTLRLFPQVTEPNKTR